MKEILQLEPLFAATKDVFQAMLGLNVAQLETESVQFARAVRVGIGVVGDMRGELSFCFPDETAFVMLRTLSGGMEVQELDDFVTSALAEVSNIISGNMMTALSNENLACDIQPPSIEILGERQTQKDVRTLLLSSQAGPLAARVVLINAQRKVYFNVD